MDIHQIYNSTYTFSWNTNHLGQMSII